SINTTTPPHICPLSLHDALPIYILAERSREYFGEGYRWYDLVRTQKWNDLASSYRIAGPNKGDHQAVTVNRTIAPHHYLRPIPQDRKSTRLNSSHVKISYAVFCL